jgi:hypothetical protein
MRLANRRMKRRFNTVSYFYDPVTDGHRAALLSLDEILNVWRKSCEISRNSDMIG